MRTHDDTLPSGTVTFLFTDIEGSTRLLARMGDRFGDVLLHHNELLRGVWRSHDGHEVSTEGDSFFVAFADPDDALRAAAAAQRALHATTWPHDTALRVRMGIHIGFARPRDGDYSAIAVNRAARILGAAHGGQVLASADVLAAASERHDVEALGAWRVRDFEGPVPLFRLRADGWDDPRTPPRLRPADHHNLVRPITRLIDREEDRDWLREQVVAGRLVTLAGPGGTGKTRLATEIGLELSAALPDGAWMVELDAVHDDDAVARAAADVFGVSSPSEHDLSAALADELLGRQMLLILDNCEQVAAGAARLAHDLLSRCEGLAILATSRRPLSLRGELVRRLLPLRTGDPSSPAVELFRDRAGSLPVAELDAATRLCAVLEGLPLAIELAAARAAALPPSVILDAFPDRPEVIGSQDPTLPHRHRSLEDVLDWSRELLDDRDQAVLRRASVFADGFDPKLAATVCAGGSVSPEQVSPVLWSLVDHSLIVIETAAGTSRFRMPTPIRVYAHQLLEPEEEARAVRSLATLYQDRLGPRHATNRTWVSEVGLELDNLGGVVRDLAAIDQPTAQELAWSIGRYHEVRNSYATAAREVRAFLDRLPEPGPNRVGLLTLLADVHLRMGQLDHAEVALDEARHLGSPAPAWDEVGPSRTRGEIALRRGDAEGARAIGRTIVEEARTPRGRARAWNLVGIASAALGDLDDALRAFQHELAAAEDGELETFLGKTHGNLAEMHLQLGHADAAVRHQLACLDTARAHGEVALVAFSIITAARLLLDRDQGAAAARLHAAAREALTEAGYELYAADADEVTTFRAACTALLDEQQMAAAEDAGRALPLADAANEAEDVLSSRLTTTG